jgi:hypothetical protein
MPKQKKSKLDQYAVTLLEMDAAKKTLPEILAWLKEEGVSVAPSTLSVYLESARSARLKQKLLGQITSGARQCREVEQEFAKNPAPELETLIKLHRVLILQLSTQGNTDPEFLKLSDQLTNTVLSCLSAQTKAAFKEREIFLKETQALEAKKSEQQKALEYCLAEAKGTPAEELFTQAFLALKKVRAGLAKA